MNLQKELADLEQQRDRSKRGKRFETFLAGMLEEEGYEVTLDPKSALPRQTDLMARHEQTFFIVEAKWTRKKSGIEDISSVRDRLARVPPDVFACIFSMAGFSEGAVQEVRGRRNQEIILFNGTEIRGIVEGYVSFQELLSEKREVLRTNSEVFLSEDPIVPRPELRLRKGSDVFQIGSQQTSWMRTDTN